MLATSPAPIRILRKPVVVDRVGLSGTTVWRMVRDGLFPAPIKLSANAIGWRESDVEAWLASRMLGVGAIPSPRRPRPRTEDAMKRLPTPTSDDAVGF